MLYIKKRTVSVNLLIKYLFYKKRVKLLNGPWVVGMGKAQSLKQTFFRVNAFYVQSGMSLGFVRRSFVLRSSSPIVRPLAMVADSPLCPAISISFAFFPSPWLSEAHKRVILLLWFFAFRVFQDISLHRWPEIRVWVCTRIFGLSMPHVTFILHFGLIRFPIPSFKLWIKFLSNQLDSWPRNQLYWGKSQLWPIYSQTSWILTHINIINSYEPFDQVWITIP